MKRIAQKKNEGKRKSEMVVRQLREGEIDTKVELIQSLIPLGLLHVGEVLQQEVAALAGVRYSRGREGKRHVRWGQQPGYVYLGGQRVAVQVPRVRDREAGETKFPETYREFQKPRGRDEARASTSW